MQKTTNLLPAFMELTLSQLCADISDSISADFSETVWVRSEISELSIRNGHCYMELIEKDESSSRIIAKMRAVCWANIFGILKPYFEQETGQALHAGLQILVSVLVEFHPAYGLQLNINDINPTYTIGDMARQRQKIIAQLQADGVMDMNKQLPFPTLPQRLAIISSETAAGYGDFCHQLQQNPYGFAFRTELFAAIMQGENAEASIIHALEQIFCRTEDFDAVVIIRGGGATTDLSCFDRYELALNCAQFPLPVVTGIGHLRDVSVLDMVAHTSLKTPTATAEFFVNCMKRQADIIAQQKQRLLQAIENLSDRQQRRIDMLAMRFTAANERWLTRQRNKLELLQKTIELHSPMRILKQGYTLTLKNGKPVTSASALTAGDQITTEFADGTVISTINNQTDKT